jgi:hypothetical protein
MWKNNTEREILKKTIWRMRISCWLSQATNTHSEFVVLNVFTLQQYLHEIASILPYKYIACLVYDSHIQHVNILC